MAVMRTTAPLMLACLGLVMLTSCDARLGTGEPSSRRHSGFDAGMIPQDSGGVVTPRPTDAAAGPIMADGGALPPTEPLPEGDPCDSLDYLGRCNEDIAEWCDEGVFKTRDCAEDGLVCEYVDDSVGFYCAAPRTPPPVPPEPGGCGNSVEQAQLRETNVARREGGLVELRCDPLATLVARGHSQDMCDLGYFSHTSRDGRSFTDRLDAGGVMYGWAAENIAYGQTTPAEVHRVWMDSPGHRRNILTGRYTRIGVGYVHCDGRHYWTQNFMD